jgi:uncharacterized protein YlzI (FlbEa/FlbD family)
MALIKLNRINKGGEIVINTDHILFIEIECRTTTIHMVQNLLFSVTETVEEIIRQSRPDSLGGNESNATPPGTAG